MKKSQLYEVECVNDTNTLLAIKSCKEGIDIDMEIWNLVTMEKITTLSTLFAVYFQFSPNNDFFAHVVGSNEWICWKAQDQWQSSQVVLVISDSYVIRWFSDIDFCSNDCFVKRGYYRNADVVHVCTMDDVIHSFEMESMARMLVVKDPLTIFHWTRNGDIFRDGEFLLTISGARCPFTMNYSARKNQLFVWCHNFGEHAKLRCYNLQNHPEQVWERNSEAYGGIQISQCGSMITVDRHTILNAFTGDPIAHVTDQVYIFHNHFGKYLMVDDTGFVQIRNLFSRSFVASLFFKNEGNRLLWEYMARKLFL